jgi:hypothetical protein
MLAVTQRQCWVTRTSFCRVCRAGRKAGSACGLHTSARGSSCCDVTDPLLPLLLLQAADLIFVHAPGSNSKVLFPEQGSPVQQSDSRVRRIPFVLRRPTYAETKRAVKVLTTLYQPDLAALQEAASKQAEAAAAAQASKAEASSSKQQDPAAEQQQQQSPGSSKAKDEPPLHKASKAGDAERVTRLLESGHDPTAQDARGRVPYLLAASKEVRDAFRRHAAQHPEQWDYKAAAVPSALTEEMEAAQEAKKVGARVLGLAGGWLGALCAAAVWLCCGPLEMQWLWACGACLWCSLGDTGA